MSGTTETVRCIVCNENPPRRKAGRICGKCWGRMYYYRQYSEDELRTIARNNLITARCIYASRFSLERLAQIPE